ncbi:hypothetical protein AV530_006551 [Patagioenas fasciata monilis]|uniref:Uncharacterized protein n=1 Tax=Patagioenas fasciata monilis TaxID=372326 RepID=A0A1V4KIM7_PATFA|nr:hypothetical protein AV530_006551 [Patagioenas fasciata monilis]
MCSSKVDCRERNLQGQQTTLTLGSIAGIAKVSKDASERKVQALFSCALNPIECNSNKSRVACAHEKRIFLHLTLTKALLHNPEEAAPPAAIKVCMQGESCTVLTCLKPQRGIICKVGCRRLSQSHFMGF